MRIRKSFSGTRSLAASALFSLAVVVPAGAGEITGERALLNTSTAARTVVPDNPAPPVDGARALLNRPDPAEVGAATKTVAGAWTGAEARAVDGRRALLGALDGGPAPIATGPRH